MRNIRFLVVAFVAVCLAACGSRKADDSDVDAEPRFLRVAFLPVLDAFPYHIAAAEGLFAAEGVSVEGITVASSVERDQLLQTGAVDGMLNEILTTALFNASEIRAVTVRTIRTPSAGGPIFRIVAAPGSDIDSPEDLAGVAIGGAVNSIIEYVTESMLTGAGVGPEEIDVVSIPSIPERFQLLMRGEIEAAVLPDPLGQAAIEAGARLVIDDTACPDDSVTVLTFSAQAVAEKEIAIRRFLAAWEQAVTALNDHPQEYRSLFLHEVNVPESVQDTYTIPPFSRRTIPSEAQWIEVVTWLNANGMLNTQPAYRESVASLE
jgi:NitT/TauT family transport system substrate-binding protein